MAKKKTAARKKKTPAGKAGRGKKSATAIFKSYRAGASLEELKNTFGLRGKSQLATAVLNTHAERVGKVIQRWSPDHILLQRESAPAVH